MSRLELALPPRFALGGLLAAPLVAAIGVAAAHSPTVAVLGAAAVLLGAITLANLTIGVALFTLVTFFEQTPQGEPLALSKPMGVILTISWLAALLRHGSDMPFLPRDRPVLAYLLVAFLGWAAMSVLWAEEASDARSSVGRLALVVVLVLVVHSAVATPGDLRVIAWAFVTGTFLTTVYGLVFGLSLEGRFTGGLADANFMAAALVASVAICGFLLSVEATPGRLVLIGFAVLDLVALVMTQSRGGLAAMAVVLVAGCLLAGRWRERAVAAALVVAAIGIGYYATIAPATIRDRATSLSAEDSAGRTDAWRIAVRVAQDNPLHGVGLNNFPTVQSEYVSESVNLTYVRLFRELRLAAHNTYLQILSELGLIGLSLLLAVVFGSLALALGAVRAIARAGDRRTEAVGRALVTGIVGLLAAYVFLSGQYDKSFWLLLGVLAALPTVAARVVRARSEPVHARPV